MKSLSKTNISHNLEVYLLATASLISCLPLWLIDYLPMLDLPQHAGQVAVLLNYTDPGTGYQDIFRLNFFTPYLLGYGILYLLGLLVDIPIAIKIILTLSFIATIFLSRELLNQFGADKKLAWLILPINYGFAFYWGFFTYIVSIPVFVLFLLIAHRYLEKPSLKMGVSVGLSSVVLFFCHLIPFGIAMIIAGLLTLSRHGFKRLPLFLPYFTAAPLVIFWFLRTTSAEPGATSTVWNTGFYRIPQMFSYTVGVEEQMTHIILGVILFILPVLLDGRLTRKKWKWMPFLTLATVFFFTPMLLANILFVYERVALLLFLSYLLLFEFDVGINTFKLSSTAIYSFILLGIVLVKFIDFKHETAGFKELISTLPEHKRVLSMIFKTKGDVFDNHPIYLNLPVWYQAEKKGIVDYNFANNYPQIVRFRDEKKPKISYGFDTRPYTFDWDKHNAEIYDYFIVRSEKDITRALFKQNIDNVYLEHKLGTWWIYRNRLREQ